ncbi:uncharacterized protein JCM6883_005565 [Sporobolomyces salmoneus]|uniref:uncharacterized protein n=1 Tax=Sporobolomyces salmoneus TaxID=183962 RepID=UPI0031780DB0
MEDWDHPWRYTISNVIRGVIEMEKTARAAGLIVESNLSQVVEVFYLQVVECYNRAVGDLYFNGLVNPLEYALSLAQKHGLDINRLEIDLEEDFNCADLEWFHVRVDGVEGLIGREYCYVHGLKYRKSSKYHKSASKENESHGSDCSSEESEAD